MSTENTEVAAFLRDVATHELKIIRDDGLYRHLRCVGAEGSIHWFEILTWHNRLCITGDMGTFVFMRLPDMFEFFRNKDGRINPSYWAEKVEAVDKHGSLTHWSSDVWEALVKELLDEFIAKNSRIGEQEATEIREAVEIEVSNEEHDAVESAHDFEYDGHPVFFDMWDHDCRVWSPRFIWCLYAIVWAIEKYDNVSALCSSISRGTKGCTASNAGETS